MVRPRAFDTDAAIEAAMQQFWSEGYAATTPAALERVTGLGRGSLYNAFSSKRELFLCALRSYIEQGFELMLAALSAPGSARDRLTGALTTIAEDPSGRGCMVTNTAIELAGRDPEVGAMISELFDRQRAAIVQAVAAGIAEGDFDPGLSPAAAAEYLVALMNGLRVIQRGDATVRVARDTAALAMTALEQGARQR